MDDNYQQWMLLQEKSELFHARSASVWCDRRQHLLILNYPSDKHVPINSAGSTLNLTDHSSVISGNSTQIVDVQTVICLERIQYIQRGGGTATGRSACDYHQLQAIRQLDQSGRYGPEHKRLEIYYCPDHPRSEYLYKSISFQLRKLEKGFDEWINALYAVIHEAKNVNEAAKRNRWLLREYEKLKRSSGGLTFDSINGWLNSHIGLVGEKTNVEKQIKQNEIFRQSNEITDSVFKATYNYFVDKQQENLIKILMSDLIEENRISLEKFATRVTNNEIGLVPHELENILKSLRLNREQTDISLKQCINYLWSDANSAFEPISRTTCTHDMNQPLNYYWISSSHNTYLAKTQLFNPASVHCYIQALLKGCRCIEIDVVDSRTGAEPEITHKNTRIKPIPLRDVLEAILDYAFVTSEFPIIISVENHCSAEQRSIMARMFIEIFGESLIQSPLSPNETALPSPNQLKRKILLKDSKINIAMISQTNVDADEPAYISTLSLQGHAQLYDFAKRNWLDYNYTITKDDVFLAKDDEARKQRSSDDDDLSDEEHDENVLDGDLTQIWYHGNITHSDARRLLLSNAGYEIGTFLIRKSSNKNCYCISYLAPDSAVRSSEIKEDRNEDGKCIYSISNKTFESIPDLVAHYRTYDFAESIAGSNEKSSTRLGKPLPRVKWRHELRRQAWFQPDLTRQQAEDLLSAIGEEMTFLIRESSNRAGQDYTISVYTNGVVRHSPIFRDGSDLMLMSLTFTSLIDLVNYYRRKPIFRQLTLKNPATTYSDFFAQRLHAAQETNQNIIYKPLTSEISLKTDEVQQVELERNADDRSVKVELHFHDTNDTRPKGYLLKFDSVRDRQLFTTRRTSVPSSITSMNRSHDESPSRTYTTGTKLTTHSSSGEQARICAAEFSRLIIYCQGVKLKDLNVIKPQDLLDKIKSCKEMISLNFVKASTFCTEDIRSMILFNQRHFTRVYPDFSRRSWSSYNFEPVSYWLAGCQMIALNFQMPDRPMHYNAGRFGANGGCGYVLMPDYIRSFKIHMLDLDTISTLLKLRVVAVRHLRTNQAKSISKVHVRTIIIGKQPRPAENQTSTTIINGPCGIWDSKQSSSKHHDHLHAYNRLQSDDSDVDLLYFEVLTDNQDFCGQAAIPLSSLRPGIRSIQLYDKFNERLDMSAILVDIIFKNM